MATHTPEELTDTIRGWAEDMGLRPDATAEGRLVYAIVRGRLRANDALESDADIADRREAFQMIQEQFEGVSPEDYDRARNLIPALKFALSGADSAEADA